MEDGIGRFNYIGGTEQNHKRTTFQVCQSNSTEKKGGEKVVRAFVSDTFKGQNLVVR